MAYDSNLLPKMMKVNRWNEYQFVDGEGRAWVTNDTVLPVDGSVMIPFSPDIALRRIAIDGIRSVANLGYDTVLITIDGRVISTKGYDHSAINQLKVKDIQQLGGSIDHNNCYGLIVTLNGEVYQFEQSQDRSISLLPLVTSNVGALIALESSPHHAIIGFLNSNGDQLDVYSIIQRVSIEYVLGISHVTSGIEKVLGYSTNLIQSFKLPEPVVKIDGCLLITTSNHMFSVKLDGTPQLVEHKLGASSDATKSPGMLTYIDEDGALIRKGTKIYCSLNGDQLIFNECRTFIFSQRFESKVVKILDTKGCMIQCEDGSVFYDSECDYEYREITSHPICSIIKNNAK
jgi:hypothetical protein